ncbi:TolC family outer membrane protein [Onishia niordana]|uniref:TolC family outer membrane protein n=1 Tax=Onishia niordana TaxID=2508711 RepID=UPI001F0DB960|nr:TolC family outer membrane protein [Halomonas niordiana]
MTTPSASVSFIPRTSRHRSASRWLAGSLLAATMMPAAPIMAQEAPAGSMTLTEAVRQAVNSNPEVQAAWHALQASRDEVDVARGGYLPSVDATAGVGREAVSDDGAGSYSTDFVELTLTQMLYDGFSTQNEVARLDQAKQVRFFELLDASEEVASDVFRAYEDVRRYRELVSLAKDNYAKHLRVYRQIEERVASGTGRRVDLEQISGRLSLAESNLMTEAANLHDVSARFQRLVGVIPASTLAPPPALDQALPDSLQNALNMAYQGNPGFHAAIKNIEATRNELAGTRSAFQPRLEFRASTGSDNERSGVTRRDNSSAELVASMNLYRGGSDQARFRQVSDEVERSISLREQECMGVRQTTSIAYQSALRLEEQQRYLNQHRQHIDRVRGAYQQQFDIGQRTLLDVLDSENEYFDASRAYANALYDQRIAEADTLAAMGELLTELEVRREGLPSLGELGGEDVTIDPDAICPSQGPASLTLRDLTAELDVPSVASPDVVFSADALFAPGSAELSARAREELAGLAAELMARNDLARVVIAGHADSTGSDAINEPLSQARAEQVVGYLASRGVDRALLVARGFGSRKPVATNDTADGRRANRRVEINFETLDFGFDRSTMRPGSLSASYGDADGGAVTLAERTHAPSISK